MSNEKKEAEAAKEETQQQPAEEKLEKSGGRKWRTVGLGIANVVFGFWKEKKETEAAKEEAQQLFVQGHHYHLSLPLIPQNSHLPF